MSSMSSSSLLLLLYRDRMRWGGVIEKDGERRVIERSSDLRGVDNDAWWMRCYIFHIVDIVMS